MHADKTSHNRRDATVTETTHCVQQKSSQQAPVYASKFRLYLTRLLVSLLIHDRKTSATFGRTRMIKLIRYGYVAHLAMAEYTYAVTPARAKYSTWSHWVGEWVGAMDALVLNLIVGGPVDLASFSGPEKQTIVHVAALKAALQSIPYTQYHVTSMLQQHANVTPTLHQHEGAGDEVAVAECG